MEQIASLDDVSWAILGRGGQTSFLEKQI